jgi:hypothetical protein
MEIKMAVTLGRFINWLSTREALPPVDPGTVLPPDAFGTIIAMSGNVRNAALVSRQWNAQIREPYTHLNLLAEYSASPQLGSCMQGVQGTCRERVLQTVGHFQRRLRAIDPRAAELLNDKSFPIDRASLEELEKSACLIKVFDRVLDGIPPSLRPVLPVDYQERAPFIRHWLNDLANQGVLMSITGLDLSNLSLIDLPPEIGNLTSLTHLCLNNNQLTRLPESFGHLAALEYLNLAGNRFTMLPESFGDLAALRDLNLARNQFTGLPDSMNRLAGLSCLDLRGNPIADLSNINDHLKEILIM